jgi:hypothetical protein
LTVKTISTVSMLGAWLCSVASRLTRELHALCSPINHWLAEYFNSRGCKWPSWYTRYGLVVSICIGPVGAQSERVITETEYADRLAAMWQAQALANWTGRRTEGARVAPPFLTDADWRVWGTPPLDLVLQNPWRADDDTDIEYVYLHLADAYGRAQLTADEIRRGWITHINRFIWVSNARARQLMDLGIMPPATSVGSVNRLALDIDAQLTTEFFGAFAPGLPTRALELADLPIRTTAKGHAMHASQFFVVLHAYAAVSPQDLSPQEAILWVVEQARRHLPDTSVAADVVDVVLTDFLSNPDIDDWERTRDLIADRYQTNAAANGFQYRSWYESTVNFATGLMALLYDQGDLVRTIQVGTLSGWDSDNGTATMGGLLGLMLGSAAIQAQVQAYDPSRPALSNRYIASVTRDALPDRLPDDPGAEDAFTLMAQRMLPLARSEVIAAGGLVDLEQGRWLLPPPLDGHPLHNSPSQRLHDRSANAMLAQVGLAPSVTHNAGTPSPILGFSTSLASHAVNGSEHTNLGQTIWSSSSEERAFSTEGGSLQPGALFSIEVVYPSEIPVDVVRMIEGTAARTPGAEGGWLENPRIWLRIAGDWVEQSTTLASPQQPLVPYEFLDYQLPTPVLADGLRMTGTVGGVLGFVTITELDLLSPERATIRPTFEQVMDLNTDGLVNVDDLHTAHEAPVDLDGDGAANSRDVAYLEAYLRWNELADMNNQRR